MASLMFQNFKILATSIQYFFLEPLFSMFGSCVAYVAKSRVSLNIRVLSDKFQSEERLVRRGILLFLFG